LQAGLILLTLCAAATLLTISLSTLYVAQGAYDRLFERTHSAHLWLYLNSEIASGTQFEQTLTNLPGVVQASPAFRTISTTFFFSKRSESGLLLREWPADPQAVAHPLLVAGRPPLPEERNTIILDHNVATHFNVIVGDAIEVLTPTGRRPLTVVGLHVSPETCPYPHCFPVASYLNRGGLQELGLLPPGDTSSGYISIGLRLHDPVAIEKTLQAAEESLPEDAISGWADWVSTRRHADTAIQFQRTLLVTFSVVAGLAAGILIANTINGAVRAQTRQIGLLKAVGFTSSQLAWIYVSESLLLALLASITGLVAGYLIVVSTLRSITLMFGDTLVRPDPWVALFTSVAILSLAFLFTFLGMRRALRIDAVQAIRTGAERPKHRGVRLPHLPISLAVSLSDAFSQPLRTSLTILGLVMAVFTLIAALTISHTLKSFFSNPGMLGFDGDLFIRRTNYISEAEVHDLIAQQTDVTAVYTERWYGFKFPGEQAYLNARFREGDLEEFQFPLIKGRMHASPDEAVVGYGLARDSNLKIGDSLDILIADQPMTFNIVGMYRESSNLGQMLLLPSAALRRVVPDFETYNFALKLTPGADLKSRAAELTALTNDRVSVLASGDDVQETMNTLPKVMTALTVLLGCFAVVGVLNSVVISTRERQREIGLLKSVGMTPNQVLFSILAGAAGMSVLAYTIGLPVGILLIRWLIDAVARWTGFGPINAPINWLGLLLVLPAITSLAVLGAFIPAYRAGRLNVTEVLRYE
jgi:putative ABC transport system permease protein